MRIFLGTRNNLKVAIFPARRLGLKMIYIIQNQLVEIYKMVPILRIFLGVNTSRGKTSRVLVKAKMKYRNKFKYCFVTLYKAKISQINYLKQSFDL